MFPPLRRRRFALILLLVLAVIVIVGRHFAIYHTIPLSRAIRPAYWLQYLSGTADYDPQTALLQHGDPHVHAVALTFDDGPDPRYGPQIAAILHQDHIPATFFLVGIRVKQYPQITRLLAHDGFELENHTYDHQRLPALKPHEIAQELRLCDHWIFLTTGRHTTLLRPPGVEYNAKVLAVAKGLGYATVSWTCGAEDYTPHPPDWIAQRILDRTENGSIILLHQDAPTTAQALPEIIAGLRARGYQFVTISQMRDRLRHPA